MKVDRRQTGRGAINPHLDHYGHRQRRTNINLLTENGTKGDEKKKTYAAFRQYQMRAIKDPLVKREKERTRREEGISAITFDASDTQ